MRNWKTLVMLGFMFCGACFAQQDESFPAFSLNPPSGNGWKITRPRFAGLMGNLMMKKTPGWFPISSVEIPLPLATWEGLWGKESSVDQLVLTKDLSKGQMAATLVRASWTTLSEDSDTLAKIAKVRELELRKQYRVLAFKSVQGDTVLPNCLRMDAQFEGADEGKTSTNVISTRRYLCPHPDVPGYFAEVGYGEQVLPGHEPIPLEDEMKPYLQGLRFLREVDFVSYPSSRTRLVPVGYSPAHMEVQAGLAWVTGESNWLLRLDLDSVRPLGIIWLRNAVGAIAVGADELWLAHNEIDLRAPETFSTDSVKFLEHFSYNSDAEAAFAARAIWVPACAVGTFACFGKVARIDLEKQNTITRFKDGGGSLAAYGDTVWVLKDGKEQGVTRIDASRAATIADIHVPVTSTARLVADSHALWINDASSVWRVDAQSNQVTRINFQGATQSCVTGDTLWILEFTQRPGAGGFSTLSLVLHRFDPQTSKEIGTSVSLTENRAARQLQLRACGYNQVWLTDKTGVLLRLDMKF